MRTPSRRLIFTVLVVIAIAFTLILRAVGQGSPKKTCPFNSHKKFLLKIGKAKDSWVEFSKGQNEFDAALRDIGEGNYQIRFKKDKDAEVVEPYCLSKVTLKTDKVTTPELAQGAPLGDPHVTQKVVSEDPAKIQKVLDTLK